MSEHVPVITIGPEAYSNDHTTRAAHKLKIHFIINYERKNSFSMQELNYKIKDDYELEKFVFRPNIL